MVLLCCSVPFEYQVSFIVQLASLDTIGPVSCDGNASWPQPVRAIGTKLTIVILLLDLETIVIVVMTHFVMIYGVEPAFENANASHGQVISSGARRLSLKDHLIVS